jgi:GrpB-like predicted nucleotidyltransferase (UPF0157 family)
VEDSWPAWATQPVEIVAADPRWAARAADLLRALEPILDPWLEGRPEHVGSTAVPGLAAKPIVDLMAPVRSLDEARAADGPLAAVGWQLVPPELDGRPWRRMYVLPDGDRRAAHLHLVEATHPRWRDTRRFRDELRRHPQLIEEYARLKRTAAQAHGEDREAYTHAKSAFVDRVLRDAAD